MGVKADLHIHTHASDGSESPESVVLQASEKGLDLIAVTDHDATDSVAAAKHAGQAAGLRVISGIEFSVAHENELHILGYFMDTENPDLKAYTEKTRAAREQRIAQYVDRLAHKGIQLDISAIQKKADGGMLSRAHLAEAMRDAGYVTSMEQAFSEYLGRNADTYIEKEKIGKQAGIELIARCGGLSVWAHPVYHMEENFGDLLDDLLSYGLNGLEAYHPDHSDDVAETLDKLAQKKAMLVTCGSDYHGRVKPEIAIGSETRGGEYLDYCLNLFYKKATEE
jgi:3',5'-nucleoside bisphosphate phosphatase